MREIILNTLPLTHSSSWFYCIIRNETKVLLLSSRLSFSIYTLETHRTQRDPQNLSGRRKNCVGSCREHRVREWTLSRHDKSRESHHLHLQSPEPWNPTQNPGKKRRRIWRALKENEKNLLVSSRDSDDERRVWVKVDFLHSPNIIIYIFHVFTIHIYQFMKMRMYNIHVSCMLLAKMTVSVRLYLYSVLVIM